MCGTISESVWCVVVVTVTLQNVFVWVCFAVSLLTSLLVWGPSEAPGWIVCL